MLVFSSFRCSEPPKVDEDTTPPEVNILAPVTGSVVGEVVSILAYAEDNEGIDGVEFLINDTLLYAIIIACALWVSRDTNKHNKPQ